MRVRDVACARVGSVVCAFVYGCAGTGVRVRMLACMRVYDGTV